MPYQLSKEEKIKRIAEMMEEMASMPREAHIRQPGEKCAYEVYNEKEENRKKLVQDMAKTNSPYYDP